MILQNAKRALEKLTGIGRPQRRELKQLLRPRLAHPYRFKDDGRTPNNPRFALLVYRSPVELRAGLDPAAIFEELFAANGWGDSWRNGVYDFLHFHTSTHEVLGIARGRVKVQFGGSKGRAIALKAGDVVVLPAGTGHRRLSASRDLLVVGAYPRSGGDYDQPAPDQVDPAQARAAIARVKRPARDPVYGRQGPLLKQWPARNGAR
jgi:uncharacterized protein YjlB